MTRIRALAALLGALLAACSSPPEESVPSAPAAPALPPSRVAVTDEDSLRTTARRLAGLERDGLWAAHAAALDEIWGQLDEKHLGAMRDWRETELRLTEPGLPLVYPFGGPNFVDAHTFFPEASTYVLVGLEPPGRIPELDRLGDEELRAAAERLAGSFRNLVKAGYFVSTQMADDFTEAETLEGLLPMLYIFLARTGHRPVEVRYVTLDVGGRPRESAEATPGEGGTVRIDFVSEEGGDSDSPRTLYYFSQDLSDEGLTARPSFLRFLETLAPYNTYMKSAEYLLQLPEFQRLHDVLLAESRLVLQDDSGLPHRSLVVGGFDVRYFGTYTETLPAYRDYFQDDLRAAFAVFDAPPLGFAIGYHVEIGGGCLILARRSDGP